MDLYTAQLLSKAAVLCGAIGLIGSLSVIAGIARGQQRDIVSDDTPALPAALSTLVASYLFTIVGVVAFFRLPA